MRWLRRTLLAVAACVAVLAAVVAGALVWSLPGSAIRADIPGLSAPVHIAIDGDGVPHIEAANRLDGAAALGFMHARDRTAQMELMRRAASGRLSELVGGSTLRLDRYMRLLGLRRRAEAEVAELDTDTRAMLDAYARGVNAWFGRRGRFAAPETILTGEPEPWTAVDCLLWGKTMALYLAGNWQAELARAALLAKMPADAVRALWPAQDATPGPDAQLGSAAARLGALVPRFPEPFTQPDRASDEWAVDGTHSATGAPLLAGDPHLGYSAPGIWYLARIDTPEGALVGATAPGVPFLVIGHNGRIAWTFTTTGADTQDVFVETVLPDGRYATPEGPRAFETRTERIGVRGAADDVLTVRESRHGPVVSDLEGTRGGPVMAVAMAELAPHDTAAAGLLALNRAGTVAEAMAAAPGITSPVQNLLIADRGVIAMATTGRVPLRRAGDGTLPQAGADGAHDWVGFASGPALPRFEHPASGMLLNANERTVGPGFPVFMGQDWYGDWRARRIRTLLEAAPRHSVEEFARMQTDAVSAFAQAMLPRLLRTQALDGASAAALATLQGWNGAMRTDTAQPLLFNAWMQRFAKAVQERNGVPPGLGGAQPDVIARALGPSGAAWCGPACDDMLATTLAAAAADYGGSVRWGDVHAAVFAHPVLGRLPWLGQFFTWRTAQPGDGDTLFRGAMRAGSWDAIHGASYRGVYDLADLDRSVFALAPGQSGHPLRAGVANLLPGWLEGDGIRLPRVAPPAAETVDLQAPIPFDGH